MIIDIKDKLDELAAHYNTPAFIERDPVQFPRRFSKLQDIEVAAFLTATISWGNRASVLKSAEKMFAMMNHAPYDYIMNKDYRALGRKNIHRTFFEHDLLYICSGLHEIYSKNSSLEEVFAGKDLWDGIVSFRSIIQAANGGISCKHISNPDKNSTCKRLHMALRWLIRQDGIVDIGVWKQISPSELYIPLDVHVARVSREFGILERNSNDRKAVEELTSKLQELNPADPIVYDFALFGLGEETKRDK